jgi:hypothetical protein
MKGSNNYLKNQVRKNLAKAALCLIVFGSIFVALTLRIFLTVNFDIFETIGFLLSIVPLPGFYFYLRKYRIYGGGWEGEKKVVQLLSSKLSDDYTLINDLCIHNGRGDIDHVVLGPNGIFVLETKNWSGDITCVGDDWQRVGRRTFKSSPSRQVKRNAARIRRIIDSSQSFRAMNVMVEGIVVFTNNRANLRLNSPTVPILRLPQLTNYLITHVNSGSLSGQQLGAIGKEIIKQKR